MADDNKPVEVAQRGKTKYQEYLEKLESWRVGKQASRAHLSSSSTNTLARSVSVKNNTKTSNQDGLSKSTTAPRKPVSRAASVGALTARPVLQTTNAPRASSKTLLGSSIASRSRLTAVDSLSSKIKEKLANTATNSVAKENSAKGPLKATKSISVTNQQQPAASLQASAGGRKPRKINRNDPRRQTAAITSLVRASKNVEDGGDQAPAAKKARTGEPASNEDIPESASGDDAQDQQMISVTSETDGTAKAESRLRIPSDVASDCGDAGALSLADLCPEEPSAQAALPVPDASSRLHAEDGAPTVSEDQAQTEDSPQDENELLRKRLEEWKKRKEEERMKTYSLKRSTSITGKTTGPRQPISRRQTMVITSKTPLNARSSGSRAPLTAAKLGNRSTNNERVSLTSSVNKSAAVARSQSMSQVNRRQTFGVRRSLSSASAMRKSPRQHAVNSAASLSKKEPLGSSTNKRLSMATLARRSPRHQARTVKPTVASQLRRESVCNKPGTQTTALKRKSISTPSVQRPAWNTGGISAKKPVAQHSRLTKQTSMPVVGPPSNTNLKRQPSQSRQAQKPKTPVQPKSQTKNPVHSITARKSHGKMESNTKPNPRRSILKLNESQGIVSTLSKSTVDRHKVTFSSPALRGSPATNRLAKTPVKTPVKPRTEASLRAQLDNWLAAKGKTPSRYSHLRCFGSHVHNEKAKKTEEEKEVQQAKADLSVSELNQQQLRLADESLEKSTTAVTSSAPVEKPDEEVPPLPELKEPSPVKETESESISDQLNDVLDECFLLFEAGCPAYNIRQWLNEIERTIPTATKSARYWICRARIAEEEENDNHAVDVYEQAVVHDAQPANEVADALREFVIRMEDRKRARKLAAHTPGPNTMTASLPTPAKQSVKRIDVDEKNIFESSTVKYVVSDTTPFKKRQPSGSKLTPQPVVTPVRRSTRRSNSILPSMLRDHDIIVEDLDELEPTDSIFRPNMALDFDEEDESCDDMDDDNVKTSLNFDDSF